jgi:hypothetical protein
MLHRTRSTPRSYGHISFFQNGDDHLCTCLRSVSPIWVSYVVISPDQHHLRYPQTLSGRCFVVGSCGSMSIVLTKMRGSGVVLVPQVWLNQHSDLFSWWHLHKSDNEPTYPFLKIILKPKLSLKTNTLILCSLHSQMDVIRINNLVQFYNYILVDNPACCYGKSNTQFKRKLNIVSRRGDIR